MKFIAYIRKGQKEANITEFSCSYKQKEPRLHINWTRQHSGNAYVRYYIVNSSTKSLPLTGVLLVTCDIKLRAAR